MLTIKEFRKVSSIEEAYELNQKKTNRIIGGMLWLKMQTGNVNIAIDLSGLNLDTIEESDSEFKFGAMTTLRDFELHAGLNQYTNNSMKEAMRHIVGVQFRNLATVGGSIYGRYGFSDVLTMFLAMDTWVELYDRGRMPLTEFVLMEKDNDILVNVIVKKTPLNTVYLSQRNNSTDFPVITCAASLIDGEARTVIGARPGKAMIVEDEEGILKDFAQMDAQQKKEAAASFAAYAVEHVPTDKNMRASKEYRSLLVKVLTRRAWEEIGGRAE